MNLLVYIVLFCTPACMLIMVKYIYGYKTMYTIASACVLAVVLITTYRRSVVLLEVLQNRLWHYSSSTAFNS